LVATRGNMARQDAETTLSFLREKDHDLKEDKDILLAAADRDSWEVSRHLRKIGSDLLKDTEFMHAVEERNS